MEVTTESLQKLLEEAGVRPEVARAINPAEPLLRQGVDSVDFPAFCALVEEKYAVVLDDEAALRLRTLNDFARYLAEQA